MEPRRHTQDAWGRCTPCKLSKLRCTAFHGEHTVIKREPTRSPSPASKNQGDGSPISSRLRPRSSSSTSKNQGDGSPFSSRLRPRIRKPELASKPQVARTGSPQNSKFPWTTCCVSYPIDWDSVVTTRSSPVTASAGGTRPTPNQPLLKPALRPAMPPTQVVRVAKAVETARSASVTASGTRPAPNEPLPKPALKPAMLTQVVRVDKAVETGSDTAARGRQVNPGEVEFLKQLVSIVVEVVQAHQSRD